MSVRKQYSDCYTNHYVGDLAAGASVGDEDASESFDVSLCTSPSINVQVLNLAAGKSIAFKLEDSDDENAWTEVTDSIASDLKKEDSIEDNGGYKYFYAGIKKFVRVVLISSSAASGADVRVQFQRHRIWEKPNLTSSQ